MTQICIEEAARRLHKSKEETLELLKQGAFAGHPEMRFPTVDPLSLDAYIQRSRPKDQRPLIPSHAEEIAARTAWSEPEEAVIRGCQDRYEAVAEYRAEFPNSRRSDYGVGKHWYRLRAAVKKTGKESGWRRWFHRIMGWLPRRTGGL